MFKLRQFEVMHANLRRHQLVQQGAGLGGFVFGGAHDLVLAIGIGTDHFWV